METDGQEGSTVQTKEKAKVIKKCTKAEVIARLVMVMKDWPLVCDEDFVTFSKRYVAFMVAAQRKGAPEAEWLDRSRRMVKDYFNGNSGE
jgi:hypothetical protein